jgi:hypothetical protein
MEPSQPTPLHTDFRYLTRAVDTYQMVRRLRESSPSRWRCCKRGSTPGLETLARLGASEPTIGKVLSFLGGLVERVLALPSDSPLSAHANPDILQGVHSSIPPTPTPTRTSQTALPLFRMFFFTRLPVSLGPALCRPVDIAVALYLEHLDAQARYLSPMHLRPSF